MWITCLDRVSANSEKGRGSEWAVRVGRDYSRYPNRMGLKREGGELCGEAPKRGRAVGIPRLEWKSLEWGHFSDAYSRFQAVLIQGCTTTVAHDKWDASQLSKLYASERGKMIVDKHFCIEQAGDGQRGKLRAEAVLGKRKPAGNWYATFIVQHDQQVLDDVLATLPLPEFQPADHSSGGISAEDTVLRHSECLWFFVARCNSDMPGRAEHTDNIAHDGTWHYQLSGTKKWYIRPTQELLCKVQFQGGSYLPAAALTTDSALVVECRPGDVLLINTRLWWHSTEIPSQPGLSISYARDVFLPRGEEKVKEGVAPEHASHAVSGEATFDMGNVDSFRAECDIEQGDVIFNEEDMPEVPLPASSSPNCATIIWEPTGKSVLIATRDIDQGECLSVAQT